jgi:hypothetical protein
VEIRQVQRSLNRKDFIIILEIPNSIFKPLYVKESILISSSSLWKALKNPFEECLQNLLHSFPNPIVSILVEIDFLVKYGIYLLHFHQTIPREEVVHLWIVFPSVCADRSDQFLTPLRPVWLDYKGVRASLSPGPFVSLSSTNRTRFLASPHGDLRTPPWNPCSKLGFGALNHGKGLPSSLHPFSFVCALPVRPKL